MALSIIIVFLSFLLSPFFLQHCSTGGKIIPIAIYFQSQIRNQMPLSIIIIFFSFFVSPFIFKHFPSLGRKIIPIATYFFPCTNNFHTIFIVIFITFRINFPISFAQPKILCNSSSVCNS